MRLYYITRVEVPSQAAQSKQILSMSRAFHGLIGDDFKLISSGKNELEEKFINKRLFHTRFSKLRYLLACTNAAVRVVLDRNSVVFTRDIAVAYTVILFNGRSVYEAHKSPVGHFSKYLMRVLSKQENFKLIVISYALGEYYREKYGFSDNNILVAHDGVFPEDYEFQPDSIKNNIRKEFDIDDDKLLVIHTGSLYKGGAELFEYVINQNRANVFFVHVGGLVEECEHWASYYHVRGFENIRFISHQTTEVVKQFQLSADLLFYVTTSKSPIYWCTSPLKLFEYMATGIPVLGSYIGSVTEVINDSNAFCFDPDHTKTIGLAFNQFYLNREDAKKRAQNALNAVRNRYSWHIRAKQIFDFFLSRKLKQ